MCPQYAVIYLHNYFRTGLQIYAAPYTEFSYLLLLGHGFVNVIHDATDWLWHWYQISMSLKEGIQMRGEDDWVPFYPWPSSVGHQPRNQKILLEGAAAG